jgi:CelD/BcsL family acetyltransferase involved in cellulose biosynthesis
MPTSRRPVRPYFCVRALSPHALVARDLAAWAELEQRAIEPNAYASPHFVIPALRHLDPHVRATVYFVERVTGTGRELVGAGVFQPTAATRLFPMSHLVCYQSRHAYLGGLLLDRAWAGDAFQVLLDHLSGQARQNGIEIPRMWADGDLAERVGGRVAGDRQERGTLHRDPGADQRAVLDPRDAGEALLKRSLGKRLKDLDRRKRRLADRGEVGWRAHRGIGIPGSVVERFLALEHAGWKGEEGSSLRAKPADEAFFREAVSRFGAEGRALFTELTLDGEAIASTVNFLSGRVGFGFKIGWDPAFKAYSPGLLNEIEFIRHADEHFPDIDCFDSGSSADSYINEIWPARRPLATATVATEPLAHLVTGAASSARQLKRRWKASDAPTAALHALKPEWMALANESLASFAVLF